MNSSKCLIWNQFDADHYSTGADSCKVKSPRAGGCYEVTGSAEACLGSIDDDKRKRLTTWLVDQRRLGNECPKIEAKEIDQSRFGHGLDIARRTDRLLQFIKTKTEFLGQFVKLERSNMNYALAWTESVDPNEVFALVRYLKERKWVEGSRFKWVVLTIEGFQHLEQLKGQSSPSSQAFVAMWFDSSTDKAWEMGIKPGIIDSGYKPLRIDQREHLNKIDDEIIFEIKRSRFLVADFTHGKEGPRGGVYYEAGFAHGLNIPVIFTCKDGLQDSIHFDTRQFNHIFWESPEDLRKLLSKRIGAVLGDGPFKRDADSD